jgi:hypothetical protein
LHAHGFEGTDLLDFELKLTNPSTIAQQQKLELYTTKFTIAQSAAGVEGLVDKKWIRKNIFMMSDDEIRAIEKGLLKDKEMALKIEAVKLPEPPADQQDVGSPGEESDLDMSPGGEAPPTDLGGGPPPELAEMDEFEDEVDANVINFTGMPVKPSKFLSLKQSLLGETAPGPNYVERDKKNRKRRVSPLKQGTDHAKLVSHSKSKQSDSITHPFGAKSDLINPFKNPMDESDLYEEFLDEDFKGSFGDTRISEIGSIINSLKRSSNRKISESDNTSGEDES